MLRRVFAISALVFFANAAICPLDEHQVCNEESEEHKCVCAMTTQQAPPPEASCNLLIDRDDEGNFPVVSVKFNLDDSSEGLEEWPEDAFVEQISTSLRVNNEDVLILRASCKNDDDAFFVQFGILKKSNDSSPPYDEDDFVDAESVAQRMKAMGHLSQIADLDVDTIEFTNDLIDIEYDPDNTDLFWQGIGAGAFFAVSLLLGIWMTCRNRGYSDDLQKA